MLCKRVFEGSFLVLAASIFEQLDVQSRIFCNLGYQAGSLVMKLLVHFR